MTNTVCTMSEPVCVAPVPFVKHRSTAYHAAMDPLTCLTGPKFCRKCQPQKLGSAAIATSSSPHQRSTRAPRVAGRRRMHAVHREFQYNCENDCHAMGGGLV